MLLDDLAVAVYHEFQATWVFLAFVVEFGDLHPQAVRGRLGVQGDDPVAGKYALGRRLDRLRGCG